MNRPDFSSSNTTKVAVRKRFLAERKALSAEDVSQWSSLITHRFFDYLERSELRNQPAVAHIFLPIQRQNEIDTSALIYRLWRDYPQFLITVSVANVTDRQLIHYPLTATTPLIENQWGIPEPVPTGGNPLPDTAIDLVIVPLLAFDLQGHRVGYGGGFYDRFLANCRPDCVKAGVSLLAPIECISQIEPTDVKLDLCITPDRTYFFDL